MSEKEIIENIEEQIEHVKKANKCGLSNNDFAKDIQGLEGILDLYNKYKLALFIVIRNSKVLPKGLELGKSEKEINEMSYKTMYSVLQMIDFEKAKRFYDEGSTSGVGRS